MTLVSHSLWRALYTYRKAYRRLYYRSLKHNFEGKYGGQKYENFNPDILFEKLGMEPDWEKIRYYILLDELF